MKYYFVVGLLVIGLILLELPSMFHRKPKPNHKVNLSWNPSSDCTQDVCYYNVTRAFCDTHITQKIAYRVFATEYVDQNVMEGVCYEYNVEACYKSSDVCSRTKQDIRVVVPLPPTKPLIYEDEK